MKSNKEILDDYGKLIVNRILDRYYKGIKIEIGEGSKNPTSKKFNQIFDRLNNDEKKLLMEYIYENINSLLFDFLALFGENEQFKLYYETDDQKVDLVKI